jgi:hypothetical protein
MIQRAFDAEFTELLQVVATPDLRDLVTLASAVANSELHERVLVRFRTKHLTHLRYIRKKWIAMLRTCGFSASAPTDFASARHSYGFMAIPSPKSRSQPLGTFGSRRTRFYATTIWRNRAA